MQDVTRRDVLKGVGAAMGVAASAGLLTSLAQAEDAKAAGAFVPSFFEKPEAIADVAEELDYEIVVVGAGSAGVVCAAVAAEMGAKVALLQKEAWACSQGGSSAGVDLENSDPEAVAAMVSMLMEENAFRSRRECLQAWADNSGEAMQWVIDRAQEHLSFCKPSSATMEFNGKTVTFVKNTFTNKPYANNEAMGELCEYGVSVGVEAYFSTPACQLVQDVSGAVTGVIAQREDGTYAQFNASKGVVICTGDYQNDEEMCSYYLPELVNMERKQFNKTGDGHKMIVWAGGKMEEPCHTKMLHDYDGGPGNMADMPYLAVKDDGTRFVDESVEMSLLNNFLRGPQDAGWYSQVFDSDYVSVGDAWGMHVSSPEDMENYMPELDNEKKGVYPGLVNTFRADTLEELAEKVGITDVEQFLSTVARYNEICETGSDVDFGKDSKFLAPVVNPPFYAIHRHVRISAICAGCDVNAEQQCLTPEGEVIEGLYACGNASRFYGGVDYPLDITGLSIGRSYTQGYMVGKALAAK